MRIVTTEDVHTKKIAQNIPEDAENNDYWTRLQNYIPAPIVAAFLAIDKALTTATSNVDIRFYWIVFVLLIGLCVWYSYVDTTKVKAGQRSFKVRASWKQSTIMTIAFIVWAFASGGPFAHYDWYNTAFAGVVLILYTTMVPLLIQLD